MANLLRHEAVSWVNITNANLGLNSLANNSAAVLATAAAINNATTRRPFMAVSMILGSMSPGSNPFVELYLLPETATAGTYADGESGATAANHPTALNLVGVAALRTKASSTQNVLFNGSGLIEVPPVNFLLAVINRSGVAFPASGNSFNYSLHGYDLNG